MTEVLWGIFIVWLIYKLANKTINKSVQLNLSEAITLDTTEIIMDSSLWFGNYHAITEVKIIAWCAYTPETDKLFINYKLDRSYRSSDDFISNPNYDLDKSMAPAIEAAFMRQTIVPVHKDMIAYHEYVRNRYLATVREKLAYKKEIESMTSNVDKKD